MTTTAIAATPASEATSLPQQVLGFESISQQAINSFRAACDIELSMVIDRLIAASVAEADTALERTRASGQRVLDVALADLKEQTRHKDELTESILQLELQAEELQLKLQEAGEKAEAAKAEFDKEQSARERAEAACRQAGEIRAQIVSAYEEKLHAVQAALDAESAGAASLKQQLESQRSERARVLEALKVVQQACAFAESNTDGQTDRRHNAIPNDDHEQGPTTSGQHAPENDGQNNDDSAVVDAATGRNLTLVPPAQSTAANAPPELVEYVKQLFEQIEAAYWVDHRAHASTEVVDNLCVNLRYARDVFERRVGPESATQSTLFQDELSARLDAHGATSLGRHLAVAAYELSGSGLVRAEAS